MRITLTDKIAAAHRFTGRGEAVHLLRHLDPVPGQARHIMRVPGSLECLVVVEYRGGARRRRYIATWKG